MTNRLIAAAYPTPHAYHRYMIYLDHAATTPLDPRVLEAMLPFLTKTYGNPSSVHAEGRRARGATEAARERVAEAIGAEPSEIVFTASGTESNALAVNGFLARGGVLVTSAAEHEAVLRPAERLAAHGRAEILKPDSSGAISPSVLEECLIHLKAESQRPILVSLMSVNNETGALSEISELATTSAKYGASFHTDAVQAVGLLDFRVDNIGVDMASASAHKFYGPKGAGFLYVRGGTELLPIIEGAQERKRRGGTENVAAIVGMATALDLATGERQERLDHARRLRRYLLDRLRPTFEDGAVLVSPESDETSAPHIVNVAFPPTDGRPIDGEMLILNLDIEGIAVSAGSACASGALEPSHVLMATGYDRATASAAVRFSTGKDTTADEIDAAVEALEKVIGRMRRLSLA